MNSVYSSNLPDEQKAEYWKLYQDGMGASSAQLLGRRNFSPTAFLETAPDEILTKQSDGNAEMKSLLAQVIMGEISLDEFEQQKNAMIEKYKEVTEYYQKAIADNAGKADLKYNW